MDRLKRSCIKVAVSTLHGVFLVFLAILLQYIGNIRFDEIAFFRVFSIVKHNILGLDIKPVKDSICCLDVSKDQVMVDDTAMNYGRIAITDRTMLTRFFEILNRHKGEYRAVLCDVGFTVPAPNDASFKTAFERASEVFTFLPIIDEKPSKPIFAGRYGAADYTVNSGDFVKYPLFYNDTIRSLPLVMVDTNRSKYRHKSSLTYENGHLALNTFIPEFYYRNPDLRIRRKEGKSANLFYMGEVLERPDFFEACVKNKYVLVGDFSNDKHSTYLGDISGALILFDAFLTLRDNKLAISYKWVILLLVVFSIISYFIFYAPEKDPGKVAERVKVSFIKDFLVKYISYLGMLILLNLISFCFFGVFISLFYLATYLTLLRTVIKKVSVYKRTKNLFSIISE